MSYSSIVVSYVDFGSLIVFGGGPQIRVHQAGRGSRRTSSLNLRRMVFDPLGSHLWASSRQIVCPSPAETSRPPEIGLPPPPAY